MGSTSVREPSKLFAVEEGSIALSLLPKFALSQGISMRTGQFCTQRVHPVQSSEKRAFSSLLVHASQAPPMPPEYVSPPNAWPPTVWKFAHEFRQAPQRMQLSAS